MKQGEKIYYSKRVKEQNSLIEKFEKPKDITLKYNYFTCMKASGYAELVQYGERISSIWICYANSNWFKGKIEEGDIFWVEGKKPPHLSEMDELFGYKESANAIVVDVLELDHSIKITLERNENEQ